MSEDYFKSLAKKAKERNEEEKQNSGGSGFSFDPINWTAWEDTKTSKLIRMTHDMIPEKEEDLKIKDEKGNLLFNEFSPRVINLVSAYADNHKKFYAYIPNKEDEPGHIFWRMYDTVLKREWVDDPENPEKKKGVYVHQKNHPELVDRFLTNGFNHGISKNKFDRGMRPQKVLLMNVIDREKIEKHRELKHTFLLSKNVNFFEGNSFYDVGVPSYGFIEQVLDIVSIYGGLTGYDLMIERTGEKGSPWKIRNGSRYIEEVPEKLRDLISSNSGLTEEEKSWEQYAIADMYKPSSHRKWFSKFKATAKQIDLTFGTTFHDELEEKAKKEKAEQEKEKPVTQGTTLPKEEEDSEETFEVSTNETTVVHEETSRRRPTKVETTDISWETLKSFGYKGEEFFEKAKNNIERITKDGDVVWKDSVGELIPCHESCNYKNEDKRGFESPEDTDIVSGCLWCGLSFE